MAAVSLPLLSFDQKRNWSLEPLQQFFEDFAGSAHGHFVFPVFLHSPVANGAVDKPAQRAGSKLPGRAVFSAALRTLFDIPAIGIQLATRLKARQQKKKLPFDGGRHR